MAIDNPEKELPEKYLSDEEIVEHMFAKRGCCFWIPCFQSNPPPATAGSPGWERIRTSDHEERWWTRAAMKVREWSELTAGPKWKTFIRRLNRNNRSGCNSGGGGGGGIGKYKKFQYDPMSYALNFDEGQNGLDEEDYMFRDFSSRYASIPASAKSSMDLGKDGPSFT